MQARAAVEAGKHVYMAKPVAVDVPGCKSILESGKKAASKNLSFLVDFQSRSQPVFQEAAQRVHRGDIGKAELTQVFYYAGRPAPDKGTPGMDPGEQRVLEFLHGQGVRRRHHRRAEHPRHRHGELVPAMRTR